MTLTKKKLGVALATLLRKVKDYHAKVRGFSMLRARSWRLPRQRVQDDVRGVRQEVAKDGDLQLLSPM